ncbi:TPR repeat containing exported protein; Putative periplasmic protein contains a protein prenylyltransferase domain [hydrothermal vent metagenome]|uniref:TPR repeat containing exported protein Putative periplasmic protein contains a protein prenylyltransferase domain n=1 Tax=hydrothermal vent metagenome TaxID=652676 RepID=A0A1W1CL28_9ZZZZ
MREMKFPLHTFWVGIAVTGMLWAEPSVYGYRDAPSTYTPERSHGRTPAKVVITQNRDNIVRLKRRISELEERVDGLASLVEGLSITVNELQAPGRLQPAQGTANTDNTKLLKELGTMIDQINANYVSKEELQRILKSKGTYTVPKKEKHTAADSGSGSLADTSSSKLYSEGVRLFLKKRYNEAKKRFTITDTKGYKPAASNYYLGEIAYYTRKYDDAIFYFKKSAGLYDQASYIDTLLLHTAVSLEKTGDKAQAKAFYKNIIENYPGRKSARIAKEHLKKL